MEKDTEIKMEMGREREKEEDSENSVLCRVEWYKEAEMGMILNKKIKKKMFKGS